MLHRPVYVGDVLSCVQRVEQIRPAGKNEMTTTVIEVTDADCAPVGRLRTTLVSRGTAPRAAD